MGCVLCASGLICVLVWGSFSSPKAGSLFRGCHMAARPCPRVSVETPPPYVGFSSRSPSVQLSIREGEKRMERWGAPEGRETGTRGEGGAGKGGAENSHPHQEMMVVRGQEGSDSLQDATTIRTSMHPARLQPDVTVLSASAATSVPALHTCWLSYSFIYTTNLFFQT